MDSCYSLLNELVKYDLEGISDHWMSNYKKHKPNHLMFCAMFVVVLVYTHLWWEGSFTKTPKCDRVVWLPPGTRRSRVPWGSQTKLSHEGVLVKLPEHLGEYMVYPMIHLHNNPQFIGVGGCLPIFYRPRWSERVVWIETTRSWACGLDFCNKSYCVVSLCRIG